MIIFIVTISGRILDQAINKANAKTFRIRSIKQSKKKKVLHFETNNFNNDEFFITILGHMVLKPLKHRNQPRVIKFDDLVKAKVDDKVDDKPKIFFKDCEVSGDPIIHYDFAKDRYTILFPETIKTSGNRNENQDDNMWVS